MRATWALDQWCAILAVLGFARRLRPATARLRYLTQAVFPVYILHQTLIIVISRPRRGCRPARGPLLVLATFALSSPATSSSGGSDLRPLFGLKATSRCTTTSWIASPPR